MKEHLSKLLASRDHLLGQNSLTFRWFTNVHQPHNASVVETLAKLQVTPMPRFYKSDLTSDPNSPFVRDAANKLVRRSYWMDMTDQTLVRVMTSGIGANMSNDRKRAHLADLRREHLIDQVCPQEILPPTK